MDKLDIAVSTKISNNEYLLLKKVVQASYDSGKIMEPTVSRLVRVSIRAYLKKWREDNPDATDTNSIKSNSCYYVSRF